MNRSEGERQEASAPKNARFTSAPTTSAPSSRDRIGTRLPGRTAISPGTPSCEAHDHERDTRHAVRTRRARQGTIRHRPQRAAPVARTVRRLGATPLGCRSERLRQPLPLVPLALECRARESSWSRAVVGFPEERPSPETAGYASHAAPATGASIPRNTHLQLRDWATAPAASGPMRLGRTQALEVAATILGRAPPNIRDQPRRSRPPRGRPPRSPARRAPLRARASSEPAPREAGPTPSIPTVSRRRSPLGADRTRQVVCCQARWMTLNREVTTGSPVE